MTNDVASEDLTAGSDGYAERSVEAGERTATGRSIWRVSLGGLLIFAAGAMVGFAPMRAWVFLRDEPKTVMISAVVLEADAEDAAGIREALTAHAEDPKTRNLDPLTVLESRPGTKTLARPTLQATIGEPVTYFSGGEIVVSTSGGEVKTHPIGFEATFETDVRPSGNFELSVRFSDSRPADPPAGWTREGLIDLDEESIDSTVVLQPDVWEAIEWGNWTSPNPDRNRVRWIFLRVEPQD